MRPMFRTGDDTVEVAHHLAAVANTQRERILPVKESGEFIPCTRVEQDGLGPAFTRTQDVAIGEAAASHQPMEILERHAATDDIAHVHVMRLETGAIERRRHLYLTVDALLPQDSHFGFGAMGDERRLDVMSEIKRQMRMQPRIVDV